MTAPLMLETVDKISSVSFAVSLRMLYAIILFRCEDVRFPQFLHSVCSRYAFIINQKHNFVEFLPQIPEIIHFNTSKKMLNKTIKSKRFILFALLFYTFQKLMKNLIKKCMIWKSEMEKKKKRTAITSSLGSVTAFQPQEVGLNLEYIKATGKSLIIQNITYIYRFYQSKNKFLKLWNTQFSLAFH